MDPKVVDRIKYHYYRTLYLLISKTIFPKAVCTTNFSKIYSICIISS